MPVDKPDALKRRMDAGGSRHFESSINWDDSSEASRQMLTNPNSKFGVSSIALQQLAWVKSHERLGELFDYERRLEDGNPFHGNLLFDAEESTDKYTRKEIANVIATVAGDVVSLDELRAELEKDTPPSGPALLSSAHAVAIEAEGAGESSGSSTGGTGEGG